MRILFLLLFFPISSFGQMQIIGPVASSGRASAPGVSNIQNITITVNPAQYIRTNVSITANTNGATVTDWKWRVLHRYVHETSGRFDTLLHETSSVQNPTFSIDSIGFYDVQLIARNGADKYKVYEYSLFRVFAPRFLRTEANLIVNMSTGAKFYDFRGQGDKPDYKIWLEGQTTNGYLELVDLHGTVGHPVQIQKTNDNTQVTIQYSGGSGKPLYFSQYSYDGNGDAVPGQSNDQGARYIVVNGFNLDGTPGIKVTAGASSTTTVRVEGKLTDVGFYGIEIQANPLTIDGAGIAIVPTVSPVCRKANWTTNNLHVYHCEGISGEEFFYLGESSQATVYVGNHGQNPPSGIGAVVARNRIYGAGRDGGQIGCMGAQVYCNLITNFGQQGDVGGQESGYVWNDGSWGDFFGNTVVGGDMFVSFKSGEYNYSPNHGQTSPQPINIDGNIFSSGTYSEVGFDEPFAIYGQNNPNSGAGNWTVSIRNNLIDSDNKCMEFLLALGGFSSNNFVFVNNLVIKTGTAGDSQALNFTGNGKATLQTGTKTENNLVRNRGSDLSDLFFTDYANQNFSITSLLSAVYFGSPTTSTAGYDYYNFPSPVPVLGYFFGPQGNYNKRLITP